MVVIKVGPHRFEAAECWSDTNKYEQWTDDGYERITRTQVVVRTPSIDLERHINDWEREKWREIEEKEYHDEGDVPRLGIRSYADSTIGEQTPLGYFEEWSFPTKHKVKATQTKRSTREPGYSDKNRDATVK